MSGSIAIAGASLGTQLQQLLMADDIVPGADASYQTCKTLYLYHPMGGKMVDTPISLAQSQARTISIPDGPEDMVRDQFLREWENLRADQHIATAMSLARTYGIGTLALGAVDVPASDPVDFTTLARQEIFISTFDPLNTAGSLVLNQNPMSPDFQKVTSISVSGQAWHRSRVVVVMNERPVYIAYTGSAFGYVGRSVFQRALYPLKSFISTMVTDDMVARKAGLLIAKMKPAGSVVDRIMMRMAAVKRQMLKDGQTDNVLGITPDESIESLNLQNIDGAGKFARDNIITNIALAADMPAKLLNEETFAEGFGEGTEDAAKIVRYVKSVREAMAPLYAFMDRVVQHRAWNRDFYAAVQAKFPEEYGPMTYEQAFTRWQNSFTATWPSLVEEPESEKVKVAETKLKATIDLLTALKEMLDPENTARAIEWAAANFNALREMFTEPLELDYELIAEHLQEAAEAAKNPPGGMPGAPGQGGEEGADEGSQAALAGQDDGPAPDAPLPAQAPTAPPQAPQREAA